MNRWLVLGCGLVCYIAFLGAVLYALGFVGNFWVPTRLDAVPVMAEGQTGTLWFTKELIMNLVLLSVFASQHRVMARPWLRERLRSWMPEAMA